MRENNSAGFTLIELLVVMSIISLLASILLVSLNAARIKARDSVRVSQLGQLKTALDLYYADNGHYPITNCFNPGFHFNFGYWGSPDKSNAGNMFQSSIGICDTVNGPVTHANINAALSPYVQAIADPKENTSIPLYGHWYTSPDGLNYYYRIVTFPENMVSIPTSYIDTTLCGLPLSAQGACVNGTSTSTLNGLGYAWINSIYVSSDPSYVPPDQGFLGGP